MVGGKKVWADWHRLKKRGADDSKVFRPSKTTKINDDMAEDSVNLIGMRVIEAVNVLRKFLDNAHSAGLEKVIIIHGVGTGRLAKGVWEFLDGLEYVGRFYHAEPERGGGGATVVELE